MSLKDNFVISAFADEISSDLQKEIEVLKNNGISHIELRSIDGKNISEFTLAELAEVKRLFIQEGIKVSSIGSPIGKISINDPFEEHLELFRHVVEIAEFFNSPYIRLFSFYVGKDPDPFFEKVVARWKLFLEVLAGKKIILLHENEKEIYGDSADRCLKLLEALDDPKARAAFDPANFVQCEEQVYPAAYKKLRKFIEYVHIKDALDNGEVRPAGLGVGKIETVLQELSDSGYTGFLSIEPHLTYFPGFEKLELSHETSAVCAAKEEGVRTFAVASKSLRDILQKNDQKWQ